jgi:hypothetical protein
MTEGLAGQVATLILQDLISNSIDYGSRSVGFFFEREHIQEICERLWTVR